MLNIEDLYVILFTENIKLKTADFLQLYKSLIDDSFCLYIPDRIQKNPPKIFPAKYRIVYNKKWLFEKIKDAKTQIKDWKIKHKVKIITIDSFDYPTDLLSLKNPPACLFVKGLWPLNFDLRIGVVGRREVKPYTLHWMEQHLPPLLQKEKPLVISGGARGVDTKAHQLALMNHSPTLYVIPSGLLSIYPSSLETQVDHLIQSGATFLSAYPPTIEMEKQHFSDRNLIIAALSTHVLILEAEIRSGTYKTAKYSLELGREMGVVPSFPTDLSYSGSLQLIYDGAQMIRDLKDLNVFIKNVRL